MSSTTQQRWILNGELQGLMNPRDRGLAYGDGVFTTLAWRENELELFDLHMQRLARDAEQLKIKFSSEKVESHLNILKQNLITEEIYAGVFKIIITRGPAQRGYRYDARTESDLSSCFISFQAMPEHIKQWQLSGINLCVCEHKLLVDPFPGVKHLNRLQQVLARSEWDDEINGQVYHEGLLLNSQQKIIEATAANIFWIKDEVLYTPSLERQGVCGVMRQKVLILAEQLGLKLEIGEFDLEHLLQAEEVFITNSLLQICSVNLIQDTRKQKNSLSRVTFDNKFWALKLQSSFKNIA